MDREKMKALKEMAMPIGNTTYPMAISSMDFRRMSLHHKKSPITSNLFDILGNMSIGGSYSRGWFLRDIARKLMTYKFKETSIEEALKMDATISIKYWTEGCCSNFYYCYNVKIVDSNGHTIIDATRKK